MTEEINVPKLRFGHFSGIWEQKSISEVATKVTDGTHDTPKPVESGVPYITAIHVKDGSIDFDNCYYVTPEVHQVIYKRCNPEKGDLLLVNIGAGTATCAINTHDAEFSMKNVALIKPDREIIEPYFLEQIQRKSTAKLFHRLTSGGAQPFFSLKEIKKLTHYFPTLPEQQKIATFLSKVDEKIALLTEKKAKLTEYKKGVMQQLFDGSFQEQDGKLVFVPPTLRFKADDGSEFPDWDEKKLGDFYKNLSTGMTPSRKVSEYFKGDNLWITSGELNFGLVNDTKEKITAEAIKDTSLKIYPAGTFFIAITGLEAPGTRGRCAINAVPATTNQSCMAFERLDLVDTNFLYFWYKNYSEAFYCKYAQGTKQQSFNNKLVEGIPINLPVKAEQIKIANFLSGIEQKIGLVNSELEKAKEWKKGLLQQMFV
ncbi:restriction endonuclease subunit S [Vibrio parahaemolyticus O3:K56]|uniref:restriction endonuclease subunit S n=1 Tax=Vibrio parahaemolyticus TaxID=670 RepID=UPI00044A3388|nr:restriction endonuclease subunit S [Vibrio parahaemolyticus]EJG0875336.1 restriction endonuclease subunit S [Vibrio parahaemolyticus O3]EJG0903964.1 restriction endonuclease subunit S [Vibrio parahaemolyticus O3:K56]EJG1076496.1 restriction endonuclease subunit S [Vibrio parahaemolyticus O1:K56]EGR1975599.1 restriction endonuclease subunit S [Vibrio parahaemolyticus]EGR5855405.1 restriction endonuclease subunit S [Vibrio parahaemolyticus]